jgi:hypothetical protein
MSYRNAYGRFAPRPKPGSEPVLKPITDSERLLNAKALLAFKFGMRA